LSGFETGDGEITGQLLAGKNGSALQSSCELHGGRVNVGAGISPLFKDLVHVVAHTLIIPYHFDIPYHNILTSNYSI
jgi:hypothetical protein